MKRRLCWTALPSLAALTLTLVPAFAQGPAIAVGSGGAGSSPSQTYQPPARIPAYYPSGPSNPKAPANTRALIEGPSVTDYFNFEQNFISPPNPQIAVGPDDILMIVNRQIFRVPNGNAAGVTPSGLDPFKTGSPVAQKAFLDVWIGEPALNNLCPTAPRTNVSCHFENATVKYDQLHGRFLVLFTVTDTGLTQVNQQQGYTVTADRKSSWVLLVSRFAIVTDSAQQILANNQVFVTPTTPNNVTGGVNANLWTIWYGNAADGLGTDGFGNPDRPNTLVGSGNINAAPGVEGAFGNPFDCRAAAIAAAGVLPTSVCYFPTNARLGIDNDTVILTSAVYNANINTANLGPVYNPPTEVPGYAGTRVRVIKKSQLYTSPGGTGHTLTAGNQFLGLGNAGALGAHYYDVYSNNAGTGAPWAATVPPVPYTLVAASTSPVAGVAVTPGTPNNGTTVPDNYLSPLFCEPQHLRGRAMATFSNAHSPGPDGRSRSNSYLLCAISTPTATDLTTFSNLYVQTLHHVLAATVIPGSPVTGPRPFIVHGANGNALGPVDGTAGAGWDAFPQPVPVNPHKNPAAVPQQNLRGGNIAPNLFVGDNRPHKLVFREGHLYDARVISTQTTQFNFPQNPNPALQALGATTAYDVLQKLSATSQPLPVIYSFWQNTRAYAPMYEAPANVAQAGQISPINLLPFLEKLFVATTYPPLAGNPDGVNDPRSRDSSIAVPAQLDATSSNLSNCFSNHLQPSVITSPLSWPSLFDMRCGEDPYDSLIAVRNPATAQLINVVPFGIYGDSETDPNDGSLWNFGAYAKRRLSTIPTGQWGTFAANYKLSFPEVDPYGNSYQAYTDVPQSSPFAGMIRIAKQVGIVPTDALGSTFDPKREVKRSEMARWVVLSQMNEEAITHFLANTPQFGGPNTPSFADVPPGHQDFRYVETMYRRGYTRGCFNTGDALRRYCPDDPTTRKDMAVFLIRAKLNNVFPSTLSGCPTGAINGTTPAGGIFPPGIITACGENGDNFGLFVPGLHYFWNPDTNTGDNPPITGNDNYVYIQKMRELRITNGTSLGPNDLGRNGTYTPGVLSGPPQPGHPGNLTREQIASFMVRAFFH